MIVSRPGVAVRLARPEDAEAIRAIYNLEVTGSTAPELVHNASVQLGVKP